MKRAHLQNTEASAVVNCDSTPGTLPHLRNTVIAAVLASLLESNTLTGMDSVFKQSTTRLCAVIHRLERDYGWRIERRDMAAGTNDGRIASISAYWLPQATIAKAFEAGARDWVESVKVARAARRKESEKCKAHAVRLNASRKFSKPQDPRQSRLWGNV